MSYYVTYRVLDEDHTQRPYPTRAEAFYQMNDIAGFEGVTDCKIREERGTSTSTRQAPCRWVT